MKTRIFKFINFLLGGIIIRLFGGIWVVKKHIIESHGVKKELLLFLYENALNKKCSWIGFDTIFKNIPYFPHGVYGIFISREAIIGSSCIIFHQVTIGSNTLKGSNIGSPIIGDNVYIGAGAKIIGKLKIGNNCRIGANCVVYEDMPDNSVAVNAPTRIIQKSEKLDNRFFTLREGENSNAKQWYYYDDGNWFLEE